jgi:ABC-type Mn2+/Zn2+ transport system ATPase subunit
MRLVADIDAHELIRAEDVAIGRAGTAFVSGLTWTVRPGEWWWIEGANGSGKTTLLSTLLGELPPIGGRLTVHPHLADGAGLGVVLQHDELLPTLPMTVGEYVAFGAVGLHAAAGAGEAAIGAVGLDAGRSYWALSGGQRQRARVARALSRHPALVLLDEPFNHLDAAAVTACLAALRERRAAGTAVVCVGHRLPELSERAGRILLVDGRAVVEQP